MMEDTVSATEDTQPIVATAKSGLVDDSALYHALFSHMTDGAIYCDVILDDSGTPVDFVHVDVNDAFARLHGVSREQIIGKKYTEIFERDGQFDPLPIEVGGRCALEGTDVKYDLFFTPLNKWLSVSMYCPRKGFFAAIFEDITERKHAEQALKVKERNYRSIFETAAHLIATFDLQGRIVDCNRHAKTVLGYDVHELLGKHMSNLFCPTSLDKAEAAFQSLLNKERFYNVEFTMLRKDGRVADVSINASVLDGETVEDSGIICVVDDITDRKRREEELRASEREKATKNKVAEAFLMSSFQGALQEVLKIIRAEFSCNDGILGYLERDGTLVCPTSVQSSSSVDDSEGSYARCSPESLSASILGRALAEKKTFYSNSQCVMPDGIECSGKAIAVPLMFQGSPVGVFLLGNRQEDFQKNDVTLAESIAASIAPAIHVRVQDDWEKKEAERSAEQLRSSEQKYRSVVNNVGIGIKVLNQQTEIISINKRMRSWFPDLDISNNPMCCLALNLSGDMRPCDNCPPLKTLKDGLIHEADITAKIGAEIRTFRVLATPITDDAGNVVAAIEMLDDITERKQVHEALVESERRLQQLFSSVVEGIGIVDVEDNIIFCNPALAEIFEESSASDMIGKNILDYLTPDQRVIVNSEHERRNNLERSRYELQITTARNNHKSIVVSSSPQLDGNAVRTGSIVALIDITEWRHSEEQRITLERQIQQAGKLTAVGSLAAGIAHEINTPIQFVGDNTLFLSDSFKSLIALVDSYSLIFEAAETRAAITDLISQKKTAEQEADIDYLREEVPKAIEQTMDGVSRVAKIVRAMKSFAHKDSGEMAMADVNEMLSSTLIVAQNELKYVSDVVTNLEEDLPPIECYRDSLNQVFLNLLINAAHAIEDVVGDGSQGRGTITIRTRHEGEDVVISITDTGTGIEESIRDHIFDPFFTTKDVGKGTGQGLSMAHSVVVGKHKGQLTFETEVGAGTTFCIRLPASALGLMGGE
ncbi:MAG: PAS domain S-box protein [candidate division Zixibacteria bacterium]|nr:PAS domain S-box protein [candidate division Zixibacteria bacterium]